ncbi:TonB-dependent receptor plug domain-containing protein [Kordiimonas lacus]|uniref:Outer membrane receptor proteins, mostly Fe transport n=1 Tax=Kordiimonas lacus TaxID=637679 RepID=A0A1G6YCF8_9PROT|nr:TonB-dependent receptor [Kordiimonas lacus]SDD87951.1 Outer membrane receptor proteins, mostly Fe transport [Kordiimonas lacus]
MTKRATRQAYGSLVFGSALASAILPAAASDATVNASASVTIDVDHQAFDADFFEQYTPQTALDMINRLPGFVFDAGSSARGFGGTAGNVLIDGTRPTSKSGGLSEALSRIPASQVSHIEIQRGAIGAGEAAGQSMIANVVRLKDVSTGTWTVGLRKFDKSQIMPSVSGTFSTQLMGWDTSLKLVTFFKDESRQAVISRRDAGGALTKRQTENRAERNRDGTFSFDAGRDAFGGRLQLNGRLGFDSWYGDTERLGRGAGLATAPVTDRFFDDHNWEEYSGEFGADWSRTYDSGWKWRLIGLTTIEDWTAVDEISFETPLGTPSSFSTFTAKEKTTETIFRTTLGKNGLSRFKPEFGIEGAFNTLDGSLEISQRDSSSMETFYRAPSPVRVEEKRAEAFVNMVWQASDKVTLDGGLKAEISRISTSGHAEQAQTFKFLKPSLGATFNISDNLQFDVKMERLVGQLDFGDFAASADATDDRVFAGNPNLRPDRTDRLEGTVNYQFSDRGALSLTLFHEWKDDVLERIVLPSGAQARANVGSARRWGLDAQASIPLDQLLKGGLLEVELYAKESSFLDPLTNQTRRLHDFKPLEYFIDFRHDILNSEWSWGVEYESNFNWHGYFVEEFEDFEGSDRWDLFIETTQFFGVKMKLTSFYTFSVQRDRIRYLYAPTRGDTFIGTEISERERDTGFLFEISGQF